MGSETGDRYQDETWLREQYDEKRLPVAKIAEKCGCSKRTIYYWMDKFDIEKRDRSVSQANQTTPDERPWTDQDWLYEKYVTEEMTIAEMASEAGCGETTIHSWMEKHGIERRSREVAKNMSIGEEGRPWTDESWLSRQYTDRGKSATEIAEECECSKPTILYWLDKFGIKTRGRSETQLNLSDKGGPWTDEEWLRTQYNELGKTQAEIAAEQECSQTTIHLWMTEHGIEPRSKSEIGLQRYKDHHPNLWISHRGYERFNHNRGSLAHHQLLAIADGADPHKVFSGGDYHVHHKNDIPWDNRRENLEVLTVAEHTRHHATKG